VTPTVSTTPTNSITPSVTQSITVTPSQSVTSSVSVTPSSTPAPSSSVTLTPSQTPSATLTPTPTPTPTPSSFTVLQASNNQLLADSSNQNFLVQQIIYSASVTPSPTTSPTTSITPTPTPTPSPTPFTNYSGSFNGSNQYLTVGAASNWTFLSNGNSFTIECWFNVASTSTVYTLIATAAATANIGISIGLNNGIAGGVGLDTDRGVGGTTALSVVDTVGNRFTANTWNHLAVVYNSSTSTCTVYMNGVSILSATGSSFNSSAPTYTLAIGRYQYVTPGGYVNGYISNVRITNTVVYTGNFTPPTSHLSSTQSAGTNISAITGTQTQLLTLQNSTFVDNSSNNYTITNNNSVTTTSSTVPFAN
jgi:hypothetical protein